jgi:tRNA threonylcarbamoyladenosine biosynthesis protein TsaB
MWILALDTTTRPGSVALVRDSQIVETSIGDPARTHGERLPVDVLELLARHRLDVRDVDLYAVASGPGSFTGLRIGIACIQGLALATARRVVPVSALDALAFATRGSARERRVLAAWMDARRGEVFSAAYDTGSTDLSVCDPPTVGRPEEILDRWQGGASPLAARLDVIAGEGGVRYAAVVREILGSDPVLVAPPPLAGAIGQMAYRRAAESVAPAAIQPIYVRRPDAELARERAAETGSGDCDASAARNGASR